MDLKSLSHEEKVRVLEELSDWLFPILIVDGMGVQDAREVASFAIHQLVKSWEKVEAPRGMASLRKWLRVTSRNEHARLLSERGRTTSLQQPLGDSSSDEAATLEDILDDPTVDELPVVRTETITAIGTVLKKMPSRCQAKMRMSLIQCENNCIVLWSRYSREERKVTIHELSEEFGLRPGTMNMRIDKCVEHFEELWAEVTGE
jgi:DNA-directed RNA polymerase specialized sigma24 family protein